jgi:hypothetical protein
VDIKDRKKFLAISIVPVPKCNLGTREKSTAYPKPEPRIPEPDLFHLLCFIMK